jgi:hypothetical protein
VGAPAAAYFPDVAERLNGKLIISPNVDVANAVGTVNGKVIERVKILITPGGTGGYFIYGPEGRKITINLEEAIEYSESLAEKVAYERALASGGNDVHVSVNRKDTYIPYVSSDSPSDVHSSQDDTLFIESIIEAHAEGNPWNE